MTKTGSIVTEVLQLAGGKSGRQKGGKSKDMALPEAFGESLRTAALAGGKTMQGRDVRGIEGLLTRIAQVEKQVAEAMLQPALQQAVEALMLEDDELNLDTKELVSNDEESESTSDTAEPATEPGSVAASKLALLLAMPVPVAAHHVEAQQAPDHVPGPLMELQEPALKPGHADVKNTSARAEKQQGSEAESFDLPEQARPLPARSIESTASTVAASSATEKQDTAQEPPAKLVPITLTKLETSLPPAMLAANSPTASSNSGKTTHTAAPAADPALPALPQPTVVRSIEFRLQPDHLGDVKVALHLKGEELRLTVEVSTHEAHALLQRDRSALRDVLEKAGYDLAETAVAVTLRVDAQQLQPSSSTTGDNLSFQRNGNGGGGNEAYQQSANGDQSRQPGRQPAAEKESQHGFARDTQTRKDARQSGAGGIYL